MADAPAGKASKLTGNKKYLLFAASGSGGPALSLVQRSRPDRHRRHGHRGLHLRRWLDPRCQRDLLGRLSLHGHRLVIHGRRDKLERRSRRHRLGPSGRRRPMRHFHGAIGVVDYTGNCVVSRHLRQHHRQRTQKTPIKCPKGKRPTLPGRHAAATPARRARAASV